MLSKFAVFTAISLISLSGFAATDIQIQGYFPAVCKPDAPLKASVVYNAQVEAQDDVYNLSFDLGIVECAENSSAFTVYAPKAEEYIEVFSFQDAFKSFHLPIPDYPAGANHTLVGFSVPRTSDVTELSFRMDLFLYKNHIPYKVNITETNGVVKASMRAI